MQSKYLFMLLGHPGSGKTHFSKQLAEEIGAVRVNADAMRVSMFGTVDAAKAFDAETGLLSKLTFGALDYATVQILKSGYTVISDRQHNEKSTRQQKAQLADENGAKAVVLWIKTPREVSIRRGAEREESLDQRKHSDEKMEAMVDKYMQMIEAPENEPVITIDGEMPFDQQYQSFIQQLNLL